MTEPPKTSRLVEDVKYWAEWVQSQAEAQIGECYPVDADGATPVAYLWAKTIRCPHCGGEIPLIKRRWLDTQSAEPAAYRLVIDSNLPGSSPDSPAVASNLGASRKVRGYTVEVLRGPAATESDPERGTMRGATVECPYCGAPTERDRIAEQGQAGTMGQHLLVVVLNRAGQTGRDFRPATEADHAAFRLAEAKLADLEAEGFDVWGFERLLAAVPDEPTPHERARSISIRLYGIETWGQMFNARQLLTLLTFGQQIRLVRDLLSAEDADYARAITLFLDMIMMKEVVYNNNTAWWQPNGLKIAPTMARHDIQMTWDYAESNPFSGQATSWASFINAFWRSVENLSAADGQPATVRLGAAQHLPAEWTETFDAVITDPPYYDSVTYADLSDFFYPWHKRIVGDGYPEAFVTEVTPKDEELVQEAIYHGGSKASAKQFYEDGMAAAFAEMHRVLRPDGIAVIISPTNNPARGKPSSATSSAPASRSPPPGPSTPKAAACNPTARWRWRRPSTSCAANAPPQSPLRTTIRRYLERFWAAGIGGADFFMSAIGPGLSVFSRYARVERYDGSPVGVSDFLDLVRHEVAAFAIERILSAAGAKTQPDFGEHLDQPTQFYLLWRWGYGEWDVPDGEAVLLSTAVGVDLKALMERVGLVGQVKGKLRLLPPAARAEKLARVVERVAAGGAVPLVDVLHTACLLWERDRQEDLAALIAARGGELWPVAQAVVELLGRDSAERTALMSLLGTRGDLEMRAQRWAESHPKVEARVEVVQGILWEEGGYTNNET